MAGKYWTKSLNPLKVAGGGYHCTKCSPGCDHCWAEGINLRNLRSTKGKVITNGIPYDDRPVEFELNEKVLQQPFHWRTPQVIFVCDLCDLFHEQVPFEFIDKVYAVAALCPQHTFQILTKRPERDYFKYISTGQVYCENRALKGSTKTRIRHEALTLLWGGQQGLRPRLNMWDGRWPLLNVHNGVSVCNQQETDEKIPTFLQVPGHLWLSIEPMLGPIKFEIDTGKTWPFRAESSKLLPLLGGAYSTRADNPDGCRFQDIATSRIEGVIVGGESGPGARPMHPDWVRSIRDQCAAAGVKFFFKQWGVWREMAKPPARGYSGNYSKCRIVWPNGEGSCCRFKDEPETGYVWMERVTKKAAGRLLDGKEHNELPWRLPEGS